MPSPKLVPLLLTDSERDALEALARKRTASQPFVWTKSADDILETVADYCQRIIDSGR
jgi:hypothetical protein